MVVAGAGGEGGGWLVPPGKELNVLTPMAPQLTVECGWNFSREVQTRLYLRVDFKNGSRLCLKRKHFLL